MAFACPLEAEKTSARDQVISITDRLLPWEVGASSYPVKNYFPGGKDGFDAYKEPYGLGLTPPPSPPPFPPSFPTGTLHTWPERSGPRGIGIHHAGAELEPAKGDSGVKR